MTTKTPEFTSLREKIAWEKQERIARYAAFARIFSEAQYEGALAANSTTPTTMIVGSPTTPLGNDIDPSKPIYVEPEGPCGFAWVTVRPGSSSFARWLVKEGHARPAYKGGVQIWIGGYGQSYERKMAHARAMADTLTRILDAEGLGTGRRIYAGGRLD